MIESRLTPGKDITVYQDALGPLTFSTVINRVTSYLCIGQGDPWHYEIFVHSADTNPHSVDEMTFHMTVFAINEHGLRAVESYADTIKELAHHLDAFNYTLHHKTGAS